MIEMAQETQIETEPPRTYLQAPGVELRTVGDDNFLLAPDAGGIHHLSVVGAAVWKQLENPMREEEIVELLTAAFPEVDAEEIRSHTATLLEDLEDHRLVSVDPPTLDE